MAAVESTAQEVWARCLALIRDNIPLRAYKTWFEPIRAIALRQEAGGPVLILGLPSGFFVEWIEEHYGRLFWAAIRDVLGSSAQVQYEITLEDDPIALPPSPPRGLEWRATPSASAPMPTSPPLPNPMVLPGLQKPPFESQLNESYTFERFIEGDCNKLARSAAWAIAQNPGKTSFNPFLVYGGVGLGKTHLIQAIGNEVKRRMPSVKVFYISSERFTNEFVMAIQHNRVNEFSLFYRQIDLLIVDDVQFFAGKEKTQEEFFHIFNALHQSDRQIVLSSDRPPRDLQGLEDRLLSRFNWGLSVDLQPPDLETRMAILRRKAADMGLSLPEPVVDFIAQHITSNIRELEGAIIRLLAVSSSQSRPIDLALAKEALRDIIRDHRLNVTIEQIQRQVCAYFGIPEDLVRAKTRKQEVVLARHIAMYLAKKLTKSSLKTIGLHFGGRDHSTVIHACESIEQLLEENERYRKMIAEIQRKIELNAL
ncbi:MAG: chromosomal replication initiator protein DnaA [Bacteroidetes bacterium]|nr:chromosomal replication initiator protein DnaA [Rhodothermia bacterium]MCS7155849.1 chromosomal replication initiator protein DnaA [Bacteroidota bacterium]MCX7906050.1 chromosomal replication initiator protein DnaA [Bacteroidota bacterium]MDW8138178.1 chromosomal replication initiator protein DnaA [Bacteroidota bacterium]MDW8285862.1 chromosomal replication initiator protein DnaA [Bacteroidota bacterium]